MKSLMNNVRAAIVALSSISLMAPSAVLAKSPAANHVTSQSRISSSMASTPMSIRSSNGLSSDKISNLSVSSNISGNSQPGGGHIHNPPVVSSTVGSGTSKVSGLTSPWDSKVIPTGGGSVKGVAAVRSSQVMDLGSDFNDLAKGTGELIDDVFGIDHSPYKGKDDGGSAPSTAPSKPSAPASSSLASIANNNAKYYDRNAYIKPNNKNLVSKEIEKKYNDSHPIAQKNKVTGGGNGSSSQNGGSNGGGGSNGTDTGGSTSSTTGGSTSKKPHQPLPVPFPLPFPSGSNDDGGYAGGDVLPAIYNSDDPAPAPVTTASATAPVADTGIDLVLEDVKLAAPATLVAGPAYTVTFRNQGTAAAGKFEVAILAGGDGTRAEDVARAVVEVASLGAGEAKEVTLRLPQKALQIPAPNGTSSPFTRLFVAVDLMNAVAEADKTNNSAVVERAALEGGDAAN